jgi:hypothetical protein
LITGGRTVVVGWWAVGGELGGGVFGFPSLSFRHGFQEQQGPGRDVGVGGCRAFPQVRPVLEAVGGLDPRLLEQLPNKFAAFGSVVIQAFVGPLARDQHAAPSNTQMLEAVSFALAAPGRQGVPSTLGLDPIQQPHRTPRRTRSDLQFGVQPVNVITLGLGGVLVEAGGLVDAFGEVLRDALTAY